MVLLALSESNIQLVPDATLLFHLGIIALMVGLLNVTLLKPIARILEERERRTRGRFSEAESVLASVNHKLQEYELRMREARTEGYAHLERQRAKVSREREQKVGAFKTEIAGWLQGEKEKLGTEAEQVRGTLKKDAQSRAQDISRQILGRQLTVDQSSGNE